MKFTESYKEGKNHYVKTYHRPVEIEWTLSGKSLEEKIEFMKGVLSDMPLGNQNDLYRMLLMMIEDLKNNPQ